jgi:hypothetical protein
MNDRGIEAAILMQLGYRTRENGVHAAHVHPPPPTTVNACLVDFRLAAVILVDRQLLPLAAQIQDLQNVVEYLVKAQLRCRTAATADEVWQDKLLVL